MLTLARLAALMTEGNFICTEAGRDSPSEKRMRVLRPGSRGGAGVARGARGRGGRLGRGRLLVERGTAVGQVAHPGGARAVGRGGGAGGPLDGLPDQFAVVGERLLGAQRLVDGEDAREFPARHAPSA